MGIPIPTPILNLVGMVPLAWEGRLGSNTGFNIAYNTNSNQGCLLSILGYNTPIILNSTQVDTLDISGELARVMRDEMGVDEKSGLYNDVYVV